MTTRNLDRSRRLRIWILVALSLVGISVPDGAQAGAPVPGPLLFAYNYTNDHLVAFLASTPGSLVSDIPLTGLDATEFLVGIDFRPATGDLYALATSVAGDRLVTIDTGSGALTPVAAGFLAATPGGYFGVDFNPVVDRIRVVSNLDSSLRLNPNTGAIAGVDTNLAYAATDPNVGVDPGVVHVAYTNGYAGAVSTTLFGIDVGIDALVRIGSENGTPVSPNSGQLTTIGALGVDATSSGGFHIDPDTGAGWAALRVGNVSRLYSINLATGAATLAGSIGSGGDFDGLTVPEPAASGAAVAAALALFGVRRARA